MRIYVLEKMALDSQVKALNDAISFYVHKEEEYEKEYREENSSVAFKMLEHVRRQRAILEAQLTQLHIELEKIN